MEIFSIEYALLAMQNALLGAVTPELRAVAIDIDKDSDMFTVRIYYDGEASEKQLDVWRCAVTESSADLGIDCRVDDYIERLDYPKKIPNLGHFAYFRKE
ncbi:MAG: hypothetical protein NTX49_02155 [Chlamydiae bacterium]|nr:hypothetical protein [Chlamydiota bacterium]